MARAFPTEVYNLLFRTVRDTLQKLAYTHWEASLAILAVLHTWSRELSFHPHVHCVVGGGGLDADGGWISADRDRLFEHRAMQRLFRGLFLTGLTELHLPLDLDQRRSLARARKRAAAKNWVVWIEAPDARDPQHLVKYLARYVYQTAISDSRIVALDRDGVTLRTRGTATVTLAGAEFVRRFGMHILPSGFHRVRHYGLLAPGARARLAEARDIVEHVSPLPARPEKPARAHLQEDPYTFLSHHRCPTCNEPLRVTLVARDTPIIANARGPP